MMSGLTTLQTKILNMCLVDDDRVCSYYSREDKSLFGKPINFADVFRKQIRIKLARALEVDFDYLKNEVIITEDRWVLNEDGKKIKIGIYRISSKWKGKINKLINPIQNESQRSN